MDMTHCLGKMRSQGPGLHEGSQADGCTVRDTGSGQNLGHILEHVIYYTLQLLGLEKPTWAGQVGAGSVEVCEGFTSTCRFIRPAVSRK